MVVGGVREDQKMLAEPVTGRLPFTGLGGYLSGVDTDEVVHPPPPPDLSRLDEVSARQLRQHPPGDRFVAVGQHRDGTRSDIRPRMHPEQPEQPSLVRWQTLVRQVDGDLREAGVR
jgi:hypothetical protein